jgi:hypothetical protein
MQARFNFTVPTSQLPLAFQQAELALNRAVKLAEQCRSLFELQPLLTAVGVADDSSTAAPASTCSTGELSADGAAADGGAVGQQAWLRLTLIAVLQQLKVDVLLGLGGLLAGNNAAGEDAMRFQALIFFIIIIIIIIITIIITNRSIASVPSTPWPICSYVQSGANQQSGSLLTC